MKAWANEDAFGIENLKEIERPEPQPGAGEIVVAMKAASVNHRDLLTVMGNTDNKPPLVPFVHHDDVFGEHHLAHGPEGRA